MGYREEVMNDNPVGYWRLGETSGTSFNDETINNNDATSFNNPTLDQPGAIADGNRAVRFIRASNTYIEVNTENGTLDLGDIFTIEAWVKMTSVGQGTIRTIAAKGTGAYQMRISSTDKIQLISEQVFNVAESSLAILDTNYHYVVVQKSGTAVKIYIDANDVTVVLSTSALGNNNNSLRIGLAPNVGEGSNDIIDEVAIYPTMLSQGRILAHYNAGAFPNNTQVPLAVLGRGARW